MSQSYKFSLPLILGLIFLSPLFFIPGGALYLAHAKSFLFAIVLVVALVAYFVEIWKKGSVTFSKNYFFYVVLALPVVYLLSALSASPSSPSLLGYYFEIGTFGYLLLGGVAFYLSATLFTESARILQGLVAFFASISILSVFVAIKILTNGNAFVWGNFEGNMGNPLGNWTDLSLIFGLLAVFATLAIGMIPMKRRIQVALSCVFVLSVALLVITNFMPAIALTFFSAILLYAYFWKIEDHYLFTRNEQGETLSKEAKNFFTRGTTLAGALILISLLFFINPTFSGTKLSDMIANISGVQNSDVRPNLSTTINVSKATLSKQAFLGSGPNTFSQDWLAFKPAQINSTPFWGTTFPFGLSFISTQIATTGIVGTALWLAFFVFLILFTLKALARIPESRANRFILIATLLVTWFLWLATILYTPSAVILMLAFIFAGFLIAIGREMGLVPTKTISLADSSQAKFVGALTIIILSLGSLCVGQVSVKRTVAAYHFKKSVELVNISNTQIDEMEKHLNQAIRFAPVDVHYLALARLNFAKAQMIAGSASGTPQEIATAFQDALGKTIKAASAATEANPASYDNWVSLGYVYSSLVGEPLKVDGYYEKAQFAFNEAYKRNPTNPELPLLLARLEVANSNIEGARSYIRNSIALKEDYADAHLMLAQLEVSQNNLPGAITSA